MSRQRPTQRTGEVDASGLGDLVSEALSVVADRTARERRIVIPAVLARLVDAALGRSDEGCPAVARSMGSLGIPPDAVVDLYIPAAARLLGEEWTDDTASFAQVTLGSARLQSLLREIAETWDLPESRGSGRPSVLLAVPCEAQHTLGAAVLVTQLRRARLSVRLMTDARPDEVREALESESHAAMFVSASMGDPIDTVRQIVQAARGLEGASEVPVVVGGTIITERDDICDVTGAGLSTMDVMEALRFCGLDAVRAR